MNWRSLLPLALFATFAACSSAPTLSKEGSGEMADDANGKPDVESLGADCSMSLGNGSHAVNSLICRNRGGVPMYEYPTAESKQVNVLRTTHSSFLCWGHGVPHAGGNDTWYGAYGDDNSSFGFVPAVHLATTPDFDAHPLSEGLPICNVCDKQTGKCALFTDFE